MKILREGFFSGERALYNSRELEIYDSVFADGESPLKESHGIKLSECIFRWKYPLWYASDIEATRTTLLETARSGIWYTKNITMRECSIEAPKTFRRAEGISLYDCTMPNAKESLWSCKDISLSNVSVTGDYFGMNSENIRAEGLVICGNYAFDGGKNIEISNSRIISKDAFWNCENVTVRDSVIIGEYLGWNSKNVTLINCTVESNQGMCYMDNLVMRGCKTINTDLAFELSVADAEITTGIVSVKNPISGRIEAKSIGEVIITPELVDSEKTEIITRE